ncbi:amidohydrolase family protein [Variovorax sp. J22R24]|uniref:amidohydrolase family protein n=1 Tax=Variovorax gracilis TaxID=3053502 RepID=UPI0025769C68|nr:amidohydrolase family protein [Variovorax sp. J22R24]MDM0108414.1 amidohydrolase family protein [Variovorax sp. J22R24]
MPTFKAETVTAPFSAGKGRTSATVPSGACDCHVHVYDASFPAVPGARLTPPDATVADYRLLQERTGTERVVFVTPSTYGTDNRLMCRALAEVGGSARGIAVIDGEIRDRELQTMHEAGVRGARLNLSLGVVSSPDQLETLAARIAPLGWHLQLLAAPDVLAQLGDRLEQLPVDVVFDHFGRIAPSLATRHPAHALVLRLLAKGRAWVKLSGGYIVSESGPPDYEDVIPLARQYLRSAPQRVLWGSDWPHASASAGHQSMPDDAHQMTMLAHWANDEATLHRVLVDNPVALYGFPKV